MVPSFLISTSKTKLKKFLSQKKQACKIVCHRPKNGHSQQFIKQLNALNIFQINIFQTILCTCKDKIKTMKL